MYEYGDKFFSYIERGSLRSARTVIPVLKSLVSFSSVADFGCGRGAWLKAFGEFGIEDMAGIDGPYVSADTLLFPAARFHSLDLSAPIDIGRRFDLVTSFEVGEHLPKQAAMTFVESLCQHAPVVAFSAAVPGQGGEHHVNEQPYEFWRDLFAAQGYGLFDCIRPRIAGARQVEPWYRYNALLFIASDAAAALGPEVKCSAIAPSAPIPDVSPLSFRLRKRVLRRLSVRQVNRIAIAKHAVALALARVGG
jgi:hypothetical protein